VAITVLTDVSVVYASQDLSDHVESVEIDMSAEDVDITAMGSTSRAHAPGLRDDTITLNFFQDFDYQSVDYTLSQYVGVAAGATMVVKPASGTVTSVNPSYTATMFPLSYQPLAGTVGDASQTSVEFKCSAGSSITRAVS